MGNILPLELIARMVVNLRDQVCSSDIGGTGTLVACSDRPFVLTAKHVADDISINDNIVVKDDDDRPLTIPIKKLVEKSSLDWKAHSEADLAAFELFPQDSQTGASLKNRFLPLEFFSEEKSAPARELILTSIGFPLGLGTQGYFSPLTFESKASSGFLTLPRGDTRTPQTFFALENPSVGGYSGCPIVDLSVFKAGSMTTTGNGTCFYGVMHGTISDKTGGKIAMVTPSYYVHELIESF
ncbi:hypothetical protein LCGC14_0431720 [marine sediment metagenome]|uniref:Peptidase S1 domain-containing protein n=1 Tax=marine sediment metagenome TaxID=412755 RepID=A0A0F9T682_9ZZZZ|nr:hypothetical protein [Phycisphaerae bacterium]HDZ42862.1 hypothetical protein [Phycisphaerae bacterium]